MTLKQFFVTTVELNGANSLIWAHSFSLFVGLQKKVKRLTKGLLAKGMITYDDMLASDCSVMTRILSNMHEKVSATVMFMKIAKQI